jgi:hypothetical protein
MNLSLISSLPSLCTLYKGCGSTLTPLPRFPPWWLEAFKGHISHTKAEETQCAWADGWLPLPSPRGPAFVSSHCPSDLPAPFPSPNEELSRFPVPIQFLIGTLPCGSAALSPLNLFVPRGCWVYPCKLLGIQCMDCYGKPCPYHPLYVVPSHLASLQILAAIPPTRCSDVVLGGRPYQCESAGEDCIVLFCFRTFRKPNSHTQHRSQNISSADLQTCYVHAEIQSSID